MPQTAQPQAADDSGGLKRTITGRLLFAFVLGDVLGSGIYVLVGAVAGEVGGAFWIAFAAGVSVATLTGLAYAELATKYPRAAGAALYTHHAFGNRGLTFLVTIGFLSASFAAGGSLAVGFANYFNALWDLPPPLLVAVLLLVLLTLVNLAGITESVKLNVAMTAVEAVGLALVVGIAVAHVAEHGADWGSLMEFRTEHQPVLAIVAGVALAFFAMTGFENVANVAEETVDPHRAFPIALVGGMVTAGVIYVLVAVSAQLVVGSDALAASDAPLIEVMKSDVVPVPVSLITTLFALIACVAITNTTLVAVVTQPRVLYGMANEGVVPRAFARLHPTRRSPWVGLIFSLCIVVLLLLVGTLVGRAGGGIDLVARLATVTVVLLLAIYVLVISAALKLTGVDEDEQTFVVPRPLLWLGLVGNVVLLGYVVRDDPTSVLWCAGLLTVGGALYVAESLNARRRAHKTSAPPPAPPSPPPPGSPPVPPSEPR